MGRLFNASGHKTLAYYENEEVRKSPYGKVEIYYYNGCIMNSPSDYGWTAVANCDSLGYIRAGTMEAGKYLAICEDGVIRADGGKVIATYDGDMYGAAAAAAVTILGLGGTPDNDTPNCATPDKNAPDSGASDLSFLLEMLKGILSIIGMLFWNVLVFVLPIILPSLIATTSPVVMFILGFVMITYIPALIAMIVQKKRGKITLDNIRITALLWCIVGPLALIYLVRILRRNKNAQ